MYVKQVLIVAVVEFVILTTDITSGLEIISTTTTERTDANKDNRCQQDIIKTFGNTLQEHELKSQKLLQQTLKEIVHLFDKKLVEANAEFGKKQKELMQDFDKKVEEIDTKYANIQQILTQIEEKMKNIPSSHENVEHGKTNLPKNCLEALKRGNALSGVYTIQPNSHIPRFEVLCDMYTKGGGWTYVLNRFDGSQEFYLNWQYYKTGFGNLSGEFWLGLQHLHELTGSEDNQLLLEFVDWDNKYYHAMYNVFRIGNEEDGYPLKVLEGFSGDAGDSLKNHKNMKFSTHDRDQDTADSENCAVKFHGAWWYENCHDSNLAGTYFNTAKEDPKGIVWYYVKNNNISLKKVKMMVRPYYLS